jgi:uncharacterized membrane protein YkvA (DUF1232 family)
MVMGRTMDAAAIGRTAAALVERGAAILEHLQKVSPRRFAQFIRRVELAVECLRDVTRGRYRLPWKTVAALAGALAYFLSPLDVIPDFIPFTGFVDDAAVLGLVFAAAETDLRGYCEWRGLDPTSYF